MKSQATVGDRRQYCSEENLEHLESAEEPKRKIEGFIATGNAMRDIGRMRRALEQTTLAAGFKSQWRWRVVWMT